MRMLTAVLTHLPAAEVAAQLDYLARVCPGGQFVVLHGGHYEAFEPLAGDARAAFVSDPTLRGPHFAQSRNETLRVLFTRFVAPDPDVSLIHLIEYDHLLLRADFDAPLSAMAAAHPRAGLFGKHASVRQDTNWSHYLAVRNDHELDAFIARISVRADITARYGCLGDGLLLRREALAAFCALEQMPDRYFELLIPTVIHHLGFDVVDVDRCGTLYRDLRWLPPYSVAEALAAARRGANCVHPFKELSALSSIATALASGTNSSVPASRP